MEKLQAAVGNRRAGFHPALHTVCALAAVSLVLVGCGGLPHSLRRDIAFESDKLQTAEHQLGDVQNKLRQDLAGTPAVFQNVPEPDNWNATLQSARQKLDTAKNDNTELQRLVRRNRSSSRGQAEQLLGQERTLRDAAVREAQSVDGAVTKWMDLSRDPSRCAAQMQREYDAIRSADLAPVSKIVTRAEEDWPAKKSDLENRLNALQEIPKTAATEWNSTEAARQNPANGSIATLLHTDDLLSQQATSIGAKTNELRDLSGQLYYSWDKILTDLDAPRFGSDREYRERIKTVRTHILDVPAKKSETSSEERWVSVSPQAYRAVEKDLGMVIAHKDAGLYDTEAQTTPQPPGFAYIAPESQGSNQYGYWSHRNGESVWTWLPQYLILRELLRGPDYRPIILDEYRGYRTAQQTGHTYYGQTTPTSPPRYGTHGTYTEQHYAQSRYAQHGGFAASGYASHNGNGASGSFSSPRPEEHPEVAPNNGAGRRFGSGFGSSPGRRFGRQGGFRSPGRGFGRRR
jgi:hypothetical protein